MPTPQQERPSYSPEDLLAGRVHRELLRAHALAIAAESHHHHQQRSPLPTDEEKRPSIHLAERSLSHTHLAIGLSEPRALYSQPERQNQLETDLDRALLAEASLLRRLGLEQQSTVVEITAAARAEGLAITSDDGPAGGRLLVGGADFEKVLELWCQEEDGETRPLHGSSDPASTDLMQMQRDVSASGGNGHMHNGDEEDLYWDHALFRDPERAGEKMVSEVFTEVRPQETVDSSSRNVSMRPKPPLRRSPGNQRVQRFCDTTQAP